MRKKTKKSSRRWAQNKAALSSSKMNASRISRTQAYARRIRRKTGKVAKDDCPKMQPVAKKQVSHKPVTGNILKRLFRRGQGK